MPDIATVPSLIIRSHRAVDMKMRKTAWVTNAKPDTHMLENSNMQQVAFCAPKSATMSKQGWTLQVWNSVLDVFKLPQRNSLMQTGTITSTANMSIELWQWIAATPKTSKLIVLLENL